MIDRVFEGVFLIDIIINFNTGYRDHDVVVVDRALIAQNYIFGWFIVDLIATIPFDLIFESFSVDTVHGTHHILQVSKISRILKLLRLFRARRVFLTVRESLRFGHTVERLAKLIMSAVFVAHWFACTFYFIGITEKNAGSPNWIDFEGLSQAGRAEMYITSVYWAMATMTTVGMCSLPSP